ncbi:hypothetical protein BVC71_14035 [Marivivens niveibacter]|uniref:Uncharacterized protein n=1 Tax=Marivivens niveibacter TaxID=1930667 RepID=A0A251WVZ0_9RHOB|nr:energy-coupling factor transporter transmembrane component T [Marivivens niveibacter]OUD08288.1 hypothetical protein BVC71_14035 [Marivivens niveibacter]
MLALTSDIPTPLHKWSAGLKLALMSGAIVTLFWLKSPIYLALAAVLTSGLYLSFSVYFARIGLSMMRPLRFLLAFILIWHVVTGDAQTGIAIVLRLSTAVALANLVTLTTRLDDLIDVTYRMMSPLSFLGVSPKPLALAIALVVRFVPVLLTRANQMQLAFKARSTKFPTFYIILPLIMSVLDDADHVATALRAKGGLDGAYKP